MQQLMCLNDFLKITQPNRPIEQTGGTKLGIHNTLNKRKMQSNIATKFLIMTQKCLDQSMVDGTKCQSKDR